MRTLHACLKCIDVRTHNEYVKQAALQGVKLEPKYLVKQLEDLSEEQKRMMAEVTRKAAQRKVMEKAKKKGI